MDMLYVLGIGATLKIAALAYVGRRRQKHYVGTVSQIYVYPLKSAREINPELTKRVELTKHGFVVHGLGDRFWVVTRNGQRQNVSFIPRLLLIRTSIHDNDLRLEAPGMEPLDLPIYPDINPDHVVTIYLKEADQTALDCGDKAAAWISRVLEKDNVRLNYSPTSMQKRLSISTVKEWPTQIQPTDEVAFQDFVQCLIMTESSMEALNARLDKPIPALQFRPNIVVKGSVPFDEHHWENIFIGDSAQVRFVDICTRCQIVTYNPENAERDKQGEPLTEMRKFLCMEPYGPYKPVMGIHTATESEGVIKIGDPVYVIRK